MSCRTLLFAAAIVALTTTARADVIFVPDDAPTIQSAIDLAAPAGDTILVWPDTYRETVDFLGKDVAVRSVAGPELTIIDGERQGTVVTFRTGEGPGAVLDGFTITGGLANDGGGVHVASGAAPTLTSCVMRGNQAGAGGGLYGVGDLTMTACTFIENTAMDFGGGAYFGGGAKTLYGCTFEANEAIYMGGGISNRADALTLIDCLFDGNTTVEWWGGAVESSGPELTTRNCTFTRNHPALPYGAIFLETTDPTTVTLIDTVFSDNVGDGIQNNALGGGEFVLSGCTFSGNTRTGASAFWTQTLIEDCEFSNNGGRGLSIDTVIVKRSVFSSNAGGGAHLSYGQESRFDSCVFDDNTASRGAAVSVGYGSDVTLDGCTITRNHATQSGGAVWSDNILRVADCTFRENTTDGAGGAIFFSFYCQSDRSLFDANRADIGGAVAIGQAAYVAVPFVDCVFRRNVARRGGALHLGTDNVAQLTRCRVSDNVATEDGGGIMSLRAAVVATSCTFDANESGAGGGVSVAGGTTYAESRYVNCVFSGNTADTGGGLHLASECAPAFVNTTFFGNTAVGRGGALFCGEQNSPTLENCVLWGNDAPAGPEISNASGHGLSIRYSDIEGCGGSGHNWDDALGADAGGNIDADPVFVDAPIELRLGAGSPCIDAADNDAVPASVTTDRAGLERFVDDPLTTDTGAGDPPIVDMGAYEFPAACVGDLDGDDRTGFSDLLVILAAWGNTGGPEDLDNSGVVDFGDVVTLLANWGPCA